MATEHPDHTDILLLATAIETAAPRKNLRINMENPVIVPGDMITFTYLNWRSELSERTARVLGFVWGSTEWHPEKQWLMAGHDQEKHEDRLFAMKDMDNVIKCS
jgi:hypothetical protein